MDNNFDSGSGNELAANLIIDNVRQRDVEDTGNIRADLIKKFNNSVPVVVLAELSYIVQTSMLWIFPPGTLPM